MTGDSALQTMLFLIFSFLPITDNQLTPREYQF